MSIAAASSTITATQIAATSGQRLCRGGEGTTGGGAIVGALISSSRFLRCWNPDHRSVPFGTAPESPFKQPSKRVGTLGRADPTAARRRGSAPALRSARVVRLFSCAPVLVDDDLGQLLDGRLGGRLVERDHPVLDHAYAVACLQHVDVVVQDHDDRDFPLVFQSRDEVED